MTYELRPPRLDTAGALDLFTIETSLAHEHQRLMRGKKREVRWERSTAHDLPEALRAALGELWTARTLGEHRSVGIFALFTLDLLGAGAPAELLSHACRAQLDEVRHAELFARVAQLYTGKDVTPPPGIPQLPDEPDVPMPEQVAREALYLSVFAETYSSILLSALYEAAEDPVVRDTLGIVIADEVHHARMGWACLRTMLEKTPELRETLARMVVPTMDALVLALFGDVEKLPAPSLSEDQRALATPHGYITAQREWQLFGEAIREVWVPGLARLGLDASALLGRYPDA